MTNTIPTYHMTQAVSLSEYWQMLKEHDWEYEYLDDVDAWQRAHDERHRLVDITKQSSQHDELYSVMLKWALGYRSLPPQPEAEAA